MGGWTDGLPKTTTGRCEVIIRWMEVPSSSLTHSYIISCHEMPVVGFYYLGSLPGKFVSSSIMFPYTSRRPAFAGLLQFEVSKGMRPSPFHKSICASYCKYHMNDYSMLYLILSNWCRILSSVLHVSACVRNKEMSTWLCGIHSIAARWRTTQKEPIFGMVGIQ